MATVHRRALEHSQAISEARADQEPARVSTLEHREEGGALAKPSAPPQRIPDERRAPPADTTPECSLTSEGDHPARLEEPIKGSTSVPAGQTLACGPEKKMEPPGHSEDVDQKEPTQGDSGERAILLAAK